MFSEKIRQLTALLEKQELEVSLRCFRLLIARLYFFITSLVLCSSFRNQAPNGIVSIQLYSELFAAYLYQNDL